MPLRKELEFGEYHPCEEERNAIESLLYVDAKEHANGRFVQSLDNPLLRGVMPLKEQFREFVRCVCTGEVSENGDRALVEASVSAPMADRFGKNENTYLCIGQRRFWANANQVAPYDTR